MTTTTMMTSDVHLRVSQFHKFKSWWWENDRKLPITCLRRTCWVNSIHCRKLTIYVNIPIYIEFSVEWILHKFETRLVYWGWPPFPNYILLQPPFPPPSQHHDRCHPLVHAARTGEEIHLRFERNGHESGALVEGRTGVRLGITIVARVVIGEDEATISRGSVRLVA